MNTPLSTIYNDYNGNITNANLSASAAIDFSKVSGGSATALVGMATWTPTLSFLSGGTLNYSKFVQIGKMVYFRFKYTLAGAGVSGQVSISLPVNASADYAANDQVNAVVQYNDSSGARQMGTALFASATTISIFSTGSGNVIAAISSSVPFTWAVNDQIWVMGSYEAA